MILFEAICVLISWVCKWFKSADKDQHRFIGFSIQFILNLLWIIYFCLTKQYIIASNGLVTGVFIVRGMYNNRKDKE